MDLFAFLPFAQSRSRNLPRQPQTAGSGERGTVRPELEPLEDRLLPSGNVISGHVYNDANNNGIFDQGETPIANSKLELRNAQNQVVATATSNAQGYYEFSSDSTLSTTPTVLTQTVTIPPTLAGFSIDKLIDRFDSSLGQLLEVEISNAGSITSDIRAENNSPLASATISGVVSGTMTLSGQGFSLQSVLNKNAGSFNATPFDGVIDFGGSSGKALDPATAADTKSVKLTGNDMNPFIGTGKVTVTEEFVVTSTATGGGNLLAGITSTAGATVTVKYKYIPASTLKPGPYVIVQTEQPQYQPGKPYLDGMESSNGVVIPNTVGTDKINVTLGNSSSTDNNFGEVAPSSLAGNVYFDNSNNGVKDPGENGIGSVTVKLSGNNDLGAITERTVTTAADGSYKFDNLRPGNYTITETQPANFVDGKDTVGSVGGTLGNDKFSDIGLNQGSDGVNYNFGEVKAGSLSGFVYRDANNNGTKDVGELGIGGVTVTLSGSDASGGVNRTTTTASDGSYSFDELKPGTYTITETQPASYLDGKDTAGSLSGNVSNDSISAVTLQPGTSGINYNFGELMPAKLAGSVYHDTNNNGTKDGGESGISGVPLTLSGTDDLGAVSRTATTVGDGSYSFDNLRPGSYSIAETQPANFLDGKDTIGTPGGSTSNDLFSNIVLNEGVQGINNNFGELLASSLAGFVYLDSNNNGLKDGGESGISGVTVTLSGSDANGPVSRTATTGADGSYKFDNLLPGTYTITETQPANYMDGKDTVGTPGGIVGNDTFSNIVLNEGVQGANNNFGERSAISVSGFVYMDSDNDGVKDTGENGIGGVTVTLSGSDVSGPVNRTTTTGADGSYKFDNLLPGTYTITETQPTNYLDGKDTVGSQGGTLGNDMFSNVTLSDGNNGSNYNFGELTPTSLSGFVYQDINNNGFKDAGENGIAGVGVALTGANTLGPVSLQTTTDANGFYNFINLLPGMYTITETQPANFLDGKDTVGSQGGTLGNDVFSNISLTQNANGANYNFGELMPASLSGYVYSDVNNNGFKDSGETGIGGVTVSLAGSTDAGLVNRTTTTANDGSYKFDNLASGTYTITETQPANFLDGKDTVGTPGGLVGNDNFSNIVLGQGVNGLNNNFGEVQGATLSGFVYKDQNDSGTKDTGESGIAGVTVSLTGTTDAGTVTRATTTAADGSYSFNNLLPGTYMLTETQPSGYVDGKDTVGSQGGTVGNDSFANIVLVSAQQGVNNNFGEREVVDLAVLKIASPTNVPAGGTVTYTLTVSNLGPSTATGVIVQDTLPAGEVFINAVAPGWTIDNSGGVLTFTTQSMVVGAVSTITVTAKAPAVQGTYDNTVTVASTTPDSNLSNNTSKARITVPPGVINVINEENPPDNPLSKLLLLASNDFWVRLLRGF